MSALPAQICATRRRTFQCALLRVLDLHRNSISFTSRPRSKSQIKFGIHTNEPLVYLLLIHRTFQYGSFRYSNFNEISSNSQATNIYLISFISETAATCETVTLHAARARNCKTADRNERTTVLRKIKTFLLSVLPER